jgi:hypothetical protein
MKRIIKIFVLSVAIAIILSCSAFALESNIDEYNKEYEVSKIYDYIDGETAQLLENFGITEININTIFSVDPSKVFNALFNISSLAIKKPIKFLTVALGVILLTSAASSFLPNEEIVGLAGSSALAL